MEVYLAHFHEAKEGLVNKSKVIKSSICKHQIKLEKGATLF
jgi:hypothetical protein